VRLLDEHGEPIGVCGRGELTAVPARLGFGDAAVPVVGFSDVWIAAERMWDPEHADRRATLQVATADGRAYLLALRRGQWSVVAGYQ
jgi:protein ImuB